MNARFAKDLKRWEAGQLPIASLKERYPAEDVDRLTSLFTDIRELSDDCGQAGDCGADWSALRSRMADRVASRKAPLPHRLRLGLKPQRTAQPSFAADMQAWEASQLPLSLVSARYPQRDPAALSDIFAQIQSLASDQEPAPDYNKGWNSVRSRIAASPPRKPAPLLDRLVPALHRRAVAGLMGALLAVPPIAIAAANEQVQQSVGNVVQDVNDFVLGSDTNVALPDSSLNGKGANSNVGPDQGGTFTSTGSGSGQSVERTPGGRGSAAAPSGPAGKSVVDAKGTSGSDARARAAAAAAGANGATGLGGAGGASGQTAPGADATSTDGANGTPAPSPSPSPGAGSSGNAGQLGTPASPPSTP